MAVSATVFKVEVGISDVDHGYDADHTLTVARHPSETDERMMVRLLAFGLRAHRLSEVDGELTFGAGLSTPGVPGRQYGREYGGIEYGGLPVITANHIGQQLFSSSTRPLSIGDGWQRS